MRSFADLTPKEKCVEMVRWVFVVPAAVLAGMAPRVVTSFLMPPALAQPLGAPPVTVPDFQRYYLPHLVGFVMAAGFVLVGAKMAPRWRTPVAVVLAVLWTAYSFLIHVWPHLGHDPRHYRYLYVAAISAAAAAVSIWHSEKTKGHPDLVGRQA
jgi:hypothetical protein